MRLRIGLLAKVTLIVFGLIVLLCPGTVLAKKFAWKLFLYFPPQVAEDFAGWCKDIKTQTDGNLDIKVYYSGEHPFNPSDLLQAVKDRSCEMANASSSYVGGVDPILTAFELPMMPDNSQSHLYIVKHVQEKWYDARMMEKWNQKTILWTCFPGQSFQVKDTFIDSFESLKGKKVRIYNKDSANYARILGATPVTIPWAEVYTAAQRGVIDGASGCLGTVYDSKWYEVFKYITVIDQGMSIDGITVNMDAWKELPQEYQKVLSQTAKVWQRKFWLRREMANYKKNVLAQSEFGCRVRYMDPKLRKEFGDRCKEKVWPDWVERTGDKDKAWEYIKECEKYRDEFSAMSKEKKREWLIANDFPEEVLD